jgi:D-arginine dehydrogenase
MPTFDFAIIGCGMAGASLAYELSCLDKKVLVLEREAYPAYHTTGRSSAFYMEAYGNETVRKITQASRDFFDQPPEYFTDLPLLKTSGALFIATAHQQKQLHALYDEVRHRINGCQLVDQFFIKEKLPPVNTEMIVNGFWEPHSMEIDVAALLDGYIKLAKKNQVLFTFNNKIHTLIFENNSWLINNNFSASTIVNAAGAWADNIAQLAQAKPLGLIPKKRTVCIAKVNEQLKVKSWPLTLDIDEQFYFKPEGVNLLITPADETPMHAHDVQAEELEIAQGIDRVQKVLNIEITQALRKWAGLRTFSKDKAPVLGYDPQVTNFFWLAGQGGYGIQMAPALAKIAAQTAVYGATHKKTFALFEKMKLSYTNISPGRFSQEISE